MSSWLRSADQATQSHRYKSTFRSGNFALVPVSPERLKRRSLPARRKVSRSPFLMLSGSMPADCSALMWRNISGPPESSLMNPKPRSAFHIFKVPVAIALYSPSPSGRRISTSAKEAHALNSAAPLATILNDVLTFSVGGAFLKLHCLFAYDADQETYEWTFIVVQMMSPGHSHRRETWKPCY